MPNAAAPAAPAQLTPFDGREVLTTTVAIRNAGDGLSAAMKVDPVELHHGEKVYIVLECEVDKLRFDPIKDTKALERVHMLKAVAATTVDEDLVRRHLDEQAERIEKHQGITRLPFDDDEDEETEALRAEHEDGQHASGLRDGCPLCNSETDADG